MHSMHMYVYRDHQEKLILKGVRISVTIIIATKHKETIILLSFLHSVSLSLA